MENVSLINVTAKNVKVISIHDFWRRMSISLDKEEIFWHKGLWLFIQGNSTPPDEALSSGCCQTLNGLWLCYSMAVFISRANNMFSHQTPT